MFSRFFEGKREGGRGNEAKEGRKEGQFSFVQIELRKVRKKTALRAGKGKRKRERGGGFSVADQGPFFSLPLFCISFGFLCSLISRCGSFHKTETYCASQNIYVFHRERNGVSSSSSFYSLPDFFASQGCQ